MSWPLTIQGRVLLEKDVAEIRRLLREHPDWNRSYLSRHLCRIWNWQRPDGQWKDIACRELLCKLEGRGLITLPPPRNKGRGGVTLIPDVVIDQSAVRGDLKTVQPVQVVDARNNRDDECLFNCLLKSEHYLGFSQSVGQNMKYLVRSVDGAPLACLLFGAAAWKVEDRDRFIGWDADTRERHLIALTNNTRFLICPWVGVKLLASHVLAKVLRRLGDDWEQRYGHRVVLLETFVDQSRFRGTCYKAANFLRVGQTKGRSRQDRYSRLRVPIKDIYVYPLCCHFRRHLGI